MAPEGIERYSRRTRRFHAAVYLLTLPLVFSGWWLLLGGEGRPSPLARALGRSDTSVHVGLGRGLAALLVLVVLTGFRGVMTFVLETARVDRGDARWLARWPAGALTGRFARHEGHFDPGQRLANVAIAGGLVVLTVTGIGLTLLHGGEVFSWLDRLHRASAVVVTVFVAGHIVVAVGLLPGYRGVWRAMHLGGRVPEQTARRLWPGWTERMLSEPAQPEPPPALAGRVPRGTRASRS